MARIHLKVNLLGKTRKDNEFRPVNRLYRKTKVIRSLERLLFYGVIGFIAER